MTDHIRSRFILGAPEYLFIKLNLAHIIKNEQNMKKSTQVKNRNPVTIPERLDLTAYQHQRSVHAPLTYKLSSVINHQGENGAGHYIATVKGPAKGPGRTNDKVSVVNDNAGHRFSGRTALNVLRANPQYYDGQAVPTSPGNTFQAAILVYIRNRGEETRL